MKQAEAQVPLRFAWQRLVGNLRHVGGEIGNLAHPFWLLHEQPREPAIDGLLSARAATLFREDFAEPILVLTVEGFAKLSVRILIV